MKLRPELLKFAEEMEMEMVLRKNDHKTGWDRLSLHQLYRGIKDEFEEFQIEYIRAVDAENDEREQRKIIAMRREAIDID